MNLTFAEQIKIILNREHMTIKTLAERMEAATGIPCSRQNLTQKLKRDNFQEQDMKILAAVLGYEVQISLIPSSQPMTGRFSSQETMPSVAPKTILPPSEDDAIPSEDGSTLFSQEFSEAELLPPDSINPRTGQEYATNTVRSHPVLAHFIQVYDATEHSWTDISEDYFLKFQEQKRKILGNDYIPPIYI